MDASILIGLALSTFASEDFASIAGGLLARDGHVHLLHAVIACAAGVYIGDLGLWWTGRVCGRRVLTWPWLRGRLNPRTLAALGERIDERLAAAVVVSRFVPGSRLPTYVAAGIWGQRPLAFAVWSLLAVMAWTPLLVVSTAYLGDAVVLRFLDGFEASVVSTVLSVVVAGGAARLIGRAAAWAVRCYHQRLDHTIETPS